MAQPHAGTCPGTLGGHDEEPHLVPGPRTQSLAQQRRDTDPVTVVHRGGEAAHTRGTLERGWGRGGVGRSSELTWAGLQPVPCPLRRKARLQGKHRRGISQGTEDREGGRERLRCPVAGGEREGVGGEGVEWKGT